MPERATFLRVADHPPRAGSRRHPRSALSGQVDKIALQEGRTAKARSSYERVLALAQQEPKRQFLLERIWKIANLFCVEIFCL